MVLSLWASQPSRKVQVRASSVYLITTLLSFVTFAFFTLVPLSKPQPIGSIIGRPEELLVGLLFLATLIGFLQAGSWKTDAFSHWLVISLVVSVVCQMFVMARSFQSHDVMFNLAHGLKILSYACVLIGILISTYHLYANAEDGAQRLRQSEERSELAVRGTSDGIWDWDLRSNAVWYSDRMRELLGYRSDDEDGFPSQLETFNHHLHPEDNKRTWAAVKQHIDHDEPFDVEYRLRTSLGQWRWFRARGACVRDHEGSAIRMAGSIRDIQQLYEQGQTLRQMERRLDQVLEGANVGLWDWNVETGDVYYSPQMKLQLGHEADEPWSDYREWESRLHEEDRAAAVECIQSYLERKRDDYVSNLPHATSGWNVSLDSVARQSPVG